MDLNVSFKKLTDWNVGIRWILLATFFEPVMFGIITFGYWLVYGGFPIMNSLFYLFRCYILYRNIYSGIVSMGIIGGDRLAGLDASKAAGRDVAIISIACPGCDCKSLAHKSKFIF